MTDADIQGHRSTNPTATIPAAISLNASTSTVIAVANTKRIFFAVSNDSNQKIWLKLQAAGIDNLKKGIPLGKGGHWEMPIQNIYTGEISAIADVGIPNVSVTEY